jgi:hypothetical protein
MTIVALWFTGHNINFLWKNWIGAFGIEPAIIVTIFAGFAGFHLVFSEQSRKN